MKHRAGLSWIIGVLGWGLLLLAVPAIAQSVQCRKVLQSFYQSLPAPHQVELPSDVKELVAKSTLAELGQKHIQGRDLLFSIDPLSKSSNLSEIVIGEEIQAHFIAQVLAKAFPQASITGVRPKDMTAEILKGKKLIELRLVDSQERKSFGAEISTNPTLLDMPMIKPANGSIRSLQKQIQEMRLQKQPSHPTATLYIPAFYFDTEFASERNPDLGTLGKHLREKLGMKTLILSPNPRALTMNTDTLESMLRVHFSEFMSPYKKIIRLSEVREISEIYQEEFNLVLNDTKGRMPFVYGMSDLVVVQGPINPAESVMVQTPTFAFVNSDVVGTYGLERYQQMVGSAQKSGKFKSVTKLEELTFQDWQRLKQQSFSPPDLIEQKGSSPLHVLLEVLQQKITAQVE